MPDRLWIELKHDTEDDVLKTVKELWTETATHRGTGGEALVIAEDDPSAVTVTPTGYARLQKFASAISAEVRFKCVEVFLSPRSEGSWRQSSPQMVAAAYRKTDSAYGTTKNPYSRSTLRKGVYCLPHQPLAPLRHLLVHGEPYAAVNARIEAFKGNGVIEDDIGSYINYRILGTVVAYAAKITREQRRGPGPELWSACSSLVGGADQDKHVRLALNHLIEAYSGRLIFEHADIAAIDEYVAKADGLIRARVRHAGTQNDTIKALPKAAEFWCAVTKKADDIGHAVRGKIDELSFGTVRFLFEARPHTYVPWLQSATLEVERARQAVYHRSLDHKISSSAGHLNKSVDVIAKSAYEQAANWLLGDGGLESMVLAPFTAENGGAIHGFVRLMNRFVGDRHYRYENEYDRDEAYLASALSLAMSDGLADPTLMSPPGP
ncbi:MAG TPA: hypothetical protein VG841_05000 [Caulobacterales bacterium]|nr:hypothetical protein [Caulobacterales bacterium]